MLERYVHGYSAREAERLGAQAHILEELIHGGIDFAPGRRVLEAGCGVGAQSVALARRHPGVAFEAVDQSAASLQAAAERVAALGAGNFCFRQADLMALPHDDGSFDAVFLCFVLEHLAEPLRALAELRRVLRPGGPLVVFEGDHGGVLAWPEDPALPRLVAAVSALQRARGGDPCIGRRLQPLLRAAGFEAVAVAPRIAYADEARPAWAGGFTRDTFTAMMAGQRQAVLAAGLLSAGEWDAGIAALDRAAAPGGTFSYSFYRAWGRRPA